MDKGMIEHWKNCNTLPLFRLFLFLTEDLSERKYVNIEDDISRYSPNKSYFNGDDYNEYKMIGDFINLKRNGNINSHHQKKYDAEDGDG